VAQKIVPNQFELVGPGIQITYSTSSISGKPLLSFKQGRKQIDFTGKGIDVLDTMIGALVTVTIASTPDLSSTTFSFVSPSIELAKESARQAFRTFGVTTVRKTSIGGAVKGVQQTYKVVQLRGSAQRVVF
jgi:hypothetical protein